MHEIFYFNTICVLMTLRPFLSHKPLVTIKIHRMCTDKKKERKRNKICQYDLFDSDYRLSL